MASSLGRSDRRGAAGGPGRPPSGEGGADRGKPAARPLLPSGSPPFDGTVPRLNDRAGTVASRRPAHNALSEFRDHPQRRLAARDALDLVEGVAPAGTVAVPGRAGAMRGGADIVEAEERIVGGRKSVVAGKGGSVRVDLGGGG